MKTKDERVQLIIDFAKKVLQYPKDSKGYYSVAEDSLLAHIEGYESTVELHNKKALLDIYLNMQYYMEYCQNNGYVTPQEWIEKYKHF